MASLTCGHLHLCHHLLFVRANIQLCQLKTPILLKSRLSAMVRLYCLGGNILTLIVSMRRDREVASCICQYESNSTSH